MTKPSIPISISNEMWSPPNRLVIKNNQCWQIEFTKEYFEMLVNIIIVIKSSITWAFSILLKMHKNITW